MPQAPAELFPPGAFIAEEMEARGLSETDLCAMLGLPAGDLRSLLDGSRRLLMRDAEHLERAFGVSGTYWLNLEMGYRKWLRGHRAREADVLRRVSENTELQRQVEASRAEHAAGGCGVPWRQIRAEKEAR